MHYANRSNRIRCYIRKSTTEIVMLVFSILSLSFISYIMIVAQTDAVSLFDRIVILFRPMGLAYLLGWIIIGIKALYFRIKKLKNFKLRRNL